MTKSKPIDLFNQPKVVKPKKEKKPKKSADRDPNVTLNEEQEEAIQLLRAFLKSDTDFDFTIDGAGGTGKSFLIQELFKRKKQNSNEWYVPNTVIGVCVTHMARINLMKSIPNTTTYASAANLTAMYDPNGTLYFVEKYGGSQFSELMGYKYIVVDECSMFSKGMIAMLRRCCSKTAKIIWLGDFCQLPPIESDGDNDSPTFDFKNKYRLTIKMRQDNEDHIAILGDEIREHIAGDKDIAFLSTMTQKWDADKGKGYSITTMDKAIDSYVKNFQAGMDIRITAYRNKRIIEHNKVIRNMLWVENSNEMYVPGELIVMNEQYAPHMNIIAYNGQSFRIQSLHIEMIEFVECFVISVPKVGRKPKSKETVQLLVPTENGYPLYKNYLDKLKRTAIKTHEWSEHQAFKGKFANISYGYAMNNYKIQGSTIKGCYVDLSDIMSVKPISNKRKLQAFYVGVSRPTDFLAIF